MLIKGYGHLLFSTVCEYFNVFICATSYEEHLKCLVLKEEFPPFMDEVNHSITTMTAAGKGNDTPLFLSSVNRLHSHIHIVRVTVFFTSVLRYGWINNAQYANK